MAVLLLPKTQYELVYYSFVVAIRWTPWILQMFHFLTNPVHNVTKCQYYSNEYVCIIHKITKNL